MEISLLIRIKTVQELADWVDMLRAFPAIGKAISLEENIEELQNKAEALREEVKKLEQQKSSLVKNPT